MIYMKKESPNDGEEYNIYQTLLQNNVIPEEFQQENKSLKFRIQDSEQEKVNKIIEENYPNYQITQSKVIKLSIVGYGIIQDNAVLKAIIECLKNYKINILDIKLTQAKIEIIVKELEDEIVEELHQKLIK